MTTMSPPSKALVLSCIFSLIIASFSAPLGLAGDFQNNSDPSFFLSFEEAEQLRLSDHEWAMPPIRTRGISSGPIITFQTPPLSNNGNPTLEASSPLSLMVIFEEKNAPVDMASLEVVAKKGFFSKSLTDRITPFVDGTTLKASGLEIPKGKFKIQIVIADIQGNQTSNEYRLMVNE